MNFQKFSYLIFILISLTSCITNNSLKVAPFEGETLLIIPPISKSKTVSDTIGRSLTQKLSQKVSTDIRYAGDIENLRYALDKSNLMSDGQINVNEASRIGAAVQANEIICTRIISNHSYPPQRATVIIILRALNGTKYRQRSTSLNINMNNIEHKKEFAEFVGGKFTTTGDRFTKKTNINLETAMLSNHEFCRFIGHKIANSILRMKQ